MNPFQIAKAGLAGLSMILEIVESEIPDGEVKTVLAKIDGFVKEALALIPAAMAEHEAAKVANKA